MGNIRKTKNIKNNALRSIIKPCSYSFYSSLFITTLLILSILSTNSALADSDKTYGPVKTGQTLWDIAKYAHKNTYSKDQSISVEQLLYAIFEQNPDAFKSANMNILVAGSKLILPEAETIKKTPKDQARKYLAQHMHALDLLRVDAQQLKKAKLDRKRQIKQTRALQKQLAKYPHKSKAWNKVYTDYVESKRNESKAKRKIAKLSALLLEKATLKSTAVTKTDTSEDSKKEITEVNNRLSQIQSSIENLNVSNNKLVEQVQQLATLDSRVKVLEEELGKNDELVLQLKSTLDAAQQAIKQQQLESKELDQRLRELKANSSASIETRVDEETITDAKTETGEQKSNFNEINTDNRGADNAKSTPETATENIAESDEPQLIAEQVDNKITVNDETAINKEDSEAKNEPQNHSENNTVTEQKSAAISESNIAPQDQSPVEKLTVEVKADTSQETSITQQDQIKQQQISETNTELEVIAKPAIADNTDTKSSEITPEAIDEENSSEKGVLAETSPELISNKTVTSAAEVPISEQSEKVVAIESKTDQIKISADLATDKNHNSPDVALAPVAEKIQTTPELEPVDEQKSSIVALVTDNNQPKSSTEAVTANEQKPIASITAQEPTIDQVTTNPEQQTDSLQKIISTVVEKTVNDQGVTIADEEQAASDQTETIAEIAPINDQINTFVIKEPAIDQTGNNSTADTTQENVLEQKAALLTLNEAEAEIQANTLETSNTDDPNKQARESSENLASKSFNEELKSLFVSEIDEPESVEAIALKSSFIPNQTAEESIRDNLEEPIDNNQKAGRNTITANTVSKIADNTLANKNSSFSTQIFWMTLLKDNLFLLATILNGLILLYVFYSFFSKKKLIAEIEESESKNPVENQYIPWQDRVKPKRTL